MRLWDILEVVDTEDYAELYESISVQSMEEILETYVMLDKVLGVLLSYADTPYVAYPLTKYAHAYALEYANRCAQLIYDQTEESDAPLAGDSEVR